MSRIMVAKTTAMIEIDGRRTVVKQGITTAHADHSVVKDHPELWQEQTVTFDVSEPVKESKPVETATAAPGEKRSVTTSSAPTRRGRRTTTSPAKEGDDA